MVALAWTVTKDELACPRLFVLLPESAGLSSLLHKLTRPKDLVVDRYRLVFLDAVTGYYSPTGPDGHGYKIELPKAWLVDNLPYIDAGLKVAKIAAACGRLSGLPIPACAGLPTAIVAKAEVQALDAFEEMIGQSHQVDLNGKKAKAATGQAYKYLRKMLADKCNDTELIHCTLEKVRSPVDGVIEWVSPQAKERFMREGGRCLVWNTATISAPTPPTQPKAPPSAKGGVVSAALGAVAGVTAGLAGDNYGMEPITEVIDLTSLEKHAKEIVKSAEQ